MRKQIVIIGGAVLGMSLAVTGCGAGFSIGEQRATNSYDVTDGVKLLDAHTGSGEIVVKESDREGVHVTETVHWRGEKPTGGHNVAGETLTLNYDCGTCSVDYQVEVPRGLQVKADSGSGTITLRGLTGQVAASTGTGDIDTRGLAGGRVSATAGSGDVKLRFSAVPQDVRVETGTGDGEVWVPAGTYNVTADTGTGERKVEVGRDAAAPRKIVVKTGTGDAGVHQV
ncbi:DUF4097 family beta strand repeat-containing protein [Microbispora sp. NPDC049125]|uniref:DUF4097 family beta strand repeat-containing protein n=1 Tax=Microbispora sp. NPDC049125 TaxID=3154929 RepID=UPI003465D93A